MLKHRIRTITAALSLCALSAVVTAAPLKWAAQNDILTLDPHSQNHATTNAILMHAYEGLTRYSKTYEVEPSLATKWTQITPTQIRFDLRKGVKFQDGSPFTADDVVFSFNRIKQPQGTMQIYVTGITEVKKVDDFTVDFILSAPSPILLRNIIDFRMMSKTWSETNKTMNVQDYKAKEENFASRNVNGTGAFRILGWSPDVSVRMEDHLGWWDKRGDSNVTRVTYNPIKSDPTRVAALISGDIDLLTDLPTQDVQRLRADPKLKILDGNEVRTIFIAMDQGSDELKTSNVKGKNPFKDKRVRQALNLATDRETIKRTIMRGLSIPAGIMVAPGVNGYSTELDKSSYDLEAAKKLLAEAGYGSGLEFTLGCPNNRYVNDEEICQALVSMWARAGVKVRLQAEPMATFIQKVQNFQLDAYMLGWGVATYDGQYSIQSLIRTKTTGANGNFNFAKISDKRIDELNDAMATEVDVAKRNGMVREALTRTRDEHLYIPLHHQMRPWAMKKGVTTQHRSDDRPEARFTRVDGGS